jgi:DNA-binding CsgD family transcriptional regulator
MRPTRTDSASCGSCEVGRISLGDRNFIVVTASDVPDWPHHEESCRFEIAGLGLVVLEATTPHGANAADSAAAEDLAARLTGRELEIAVLVAQGYATKRIAYRLQISEWTVATYLRRIFAKLNVDSRAAMVFRCAPLINASLDLAAPRRPPFAAAFARK